MDFAGDDLAIMVLESRQQLERLRRERAAKEEALAKAALMVAKQRAHEAQVHQAYQASCDRLESYLLGACSDSTSVLELEALQNLVLLRLQQDNLTFVNLRDQLDKLHTETHAKMEKLKATQLEANETASFYSRQNAISCRDGQRLRETVKSLEKETRLVEARVYQKLLSHAREVFL